MPKRAELPDADLFAGRSTDPLELVAPVVGKVARRARKMAKKKLVKGRGGKRSRNAPKSLTRTELAKLKRALDALTGGNYSVWSAHARDPHKARKLIRMWERAGGRLKKNNPIKRRVNAPAVNPESVIRRLGKLVGPTIGNSVIGGKIQYRGGEGKEPRSLWEHKLSPNGAKVIGLEDGSVLLLRGSKPLWRYYDD